MIMKNEKKIRQPNRGECEIRGGLKSGRSCSGGDERKIIDFYFWPMRKRPSYWKNPLTSREFLFWNFRKMNLLIRLKIVRIQKFMNSNISLNACPLSYHLPFLPPYFDCIYARFINGNGESLVLKNLIRNLYSVVWVLY